MLLEVNGSSVYAYTGGRAFDATRPSIVFVHGACNDHSVWALQSRYFAHHGRNVLAVDTPGHGRSAGDAYSAVSDIADWVAATPWVDFLAKQPAIRSNTSVCLKIVDPAVTALNADQQSAFIKGRKKITAQHAIGREGNHD